MEEWESVEKDVMALRCSLTCATGPFVRRYEAAKEGIRVEVAVSRLVGRGESEVRSERTEYPSSDMVEREDAEKDVMAVRCSLFSTLCKGDEGARVEMTASRGEVTAAVGVEGPAMGAIEVDDGGSSSLTITRKDLRLDCRGTAPGKTMEEAIDVRGDVFGV